MPTPFKRWRRRMYLRLPLWFREKDFEIFTAVLCLSAGVPLLLTSATTRSLDAELPHWVALGWALNLILAPICIGVGVLRASGLPLSESLFWMRLEALGLKALAYGAYIYAIAIASNAGQDGVAAVAIVTIFGFTCHSHSTLVTLEVEDYLLQIGAVTPR